MGDGRATVEGVSRFDFVVPELSLCRTFEVHVSCLWGSINTPKNTQKEIVFHIKGMYDWMQACKCRGWLTTQNHGGVWYRQYAKLQYTLITVPVRSSCVSPSLSLSLTRHVFASHLSLSLISLLANTHAHPDKFRLRGWIHKLLT